MADSIQKPKLRFKGFDDGWISKEFKEIVALTRGLTYHPSNLRQIGTRVLRSSNISEDFFRISDDEDVFVTSDVVNIPVALNGDILITAANGSQKLIGKHAIIEGLINDRAVAGGFMLLGKTNNSNFANSLMHASWYQKFLTIYSAGGNGSIANLNKAELEKYSVTVPHELLETINIGNLFSKIDALLKLLRKKYINLQHLKQTMLEKMFPKDGADVPEIRFGGFEGGWTISKFSETFTHLPNNALTRADLDDANGEYLNIHYGDILIKYPEVLSVSDASIPHVAPHTNYSIQSTTMLLKDGDIIFADAAEDETVGKAIEVQNVKDNKLISGLHTIPCRPIIICAPGYLGYYINSNLYHNQLFPLMQGSKVSSISKSAIADTMIYYPKSITEQKMIATFFNSISKQIETNEEVILKLQSMKKALLEQMFV